MFVSRSQIFNNNEYIELKLTKVIVMMSGNLVFIIFICFAYFGLFLVRFFVFSKIMFITLNVIKDNHLKSLRIVFF